MPSVKYAIRSLIKSPSYTLIALAISGLALGLPGAYALTRFLGSIMPRLASPDLIALGEVSLLLFIVTLVACWLPAARDEGRSNGGVEGQVIDI